MLFTLNNQSINYSQYSKDAKVDLSIELQFSQSNIATLYVIEHQ